jgi:hypothetical protein
VKDTYLWKTLGTAFGVIAVVFVVWLLIAGTWVSPSAQTIYVVRNGGPFDNHNIRQVIVPGSGWTWTGIKSSAHSYPDSTQQRYYTITSDPSRGDRPGVDVVTVPTIDGVQVGMEGTFYLKTAFDSSKHGIKLVRAFDDQFGTRTFPVAGTKDAKHPWSGSTGWEAFLDAVVRPVIDNELRIAIGQFKCSELLSSCALVQGTSHGKAVDLVSAGTQNQSNIQAVQKSINQGLADDLKATLGRYFFTSIQFRLGKPDLPGQIQNAIDDYQAQKVKNNTAALKVQQAEQEATANEKRTASYQKCPICGQIDQIAALKNKNGDIGANVYIGINPSGPIAGGTTRSRAPCAIVRTVALPRVVSMNVFSC